MKRIVTLSLIWAVGVSVIGCAREVSEATWVNSQPLCIEGTGCCTGSPVIVDLAGDGIHLSGPDDGVIFPLHRGSPGLWSWTLPGTNDAWLALDINGNGRIDDGSELFGDGSIQSVNTNDPNGFLALAYYDQPGQGGNGDGQIDAQDAIWTQLRLWRDANHDGVSTQSELLAMGDVGVYSFSLAAMPSTYVDGNGNAFRFTSTIVADAPVSSVDSDVWLVEGSPPVDDAARGPVTPQDTTTWTCYAWGYFVNSSYTDICNLSTTANDPIATGSMGRLTRLVSRWATSSTSHDNAYYRAGAILSASTNSAEGYCNLTSPFPQPDLYYPPPYDFGGGMTAGRIKCFSVTSGGGGGGGC
jgi:hypothetical protein